MELVDELELYTGDAWCVAVVLYEDEEPWFEEGTVAEWIYDDEDEAKDKYCELVGYGRDSLLEQYGDDYGDTLGVFLRETYYNIGIPADRYFTDEVVDEKTWRI